MEVTIKGWVHARQDAFNSRELNYVFFEGEKPWTGTDGEYIPICAHTIKFDLPADFDPRAKQVESLEKERTKLQAAFQARITEINAQIQSLLAIENKPTAPATDDIPF
jgi:hypothetical protein